MSVSKPSLSLSYNPKVENDRDIFQLQLENSNIISNLEFKIYNHNNFSYNLSRAKNVFSRKWIVIEITMLSDNLKIFVKKEDMELFFQKHEIKTLKKDPKYITQIAEVKDSTIKISLADTNQTDEDSSFSDLILKPQDCKRASEIKDDHETNKNIILPLEVETSEGNTLSGDFNPKDGSMPLPGDEFLDKTFQCENSVLEVCEKKKEDKIEIRYEMPHNDNLDEVEKLEKEILFFKDHLKRAKIFISDEEIELTAFFPDNSKKKIYQEKGKYILFEHEKSKDKLLIPLDTYFTKGFQEYCSQKFLNVFWHTKILITSEEIEQITDSQILERNRKEVLKIKEVKKDGLDSGEFRSIAVPLDAKSKMNSDQKLEELSKLLESDEDNHSVVCEIDSDEEIDLSEDSESNLEYSFRADNNSKENDEKSASDKLSNNDYLKLIRKLRMLS